MHRCGNVPDNGSVSLSSGQWKEGIASQDVGTLLIVDDNSSIRSLLLSIFSICEEVTNVFTAADGKEAVGVLQSVSVNCILTDLDMPIMNGFELISYAKANHPDIQIVVMSGESFDTVKSKLHSLGVSGYVSKPFAIEELMTSVLQV